MYFSDLGSIALFLALGFSVYTLGAALWGALRASPGWLASAKRAMLTVTFFLLLASAALITSFLLHDFGVRYVATHSSRSMPWYFVTAAFYGGQQGSLLYWALTLALFSTIFVLTSRRAPSALVPYVVATLAAIEIFLTLVLTTASNPFARSVIAPSDGQGLNPLLMDPGMLVHPPLLLLGYMSFALPFAFAVAALITGQLSSEWLRSIRRWMLAAWMLQTAGLLVGAWWAYHVLGWGGYWGWDPVENAALMPWLTATAFLHSTMVQERRGMLKVWNLFLTIASFALSFFGTFVVRSGIISSVHSFAYSEVGIFFFVFLAIIVLFSSALFFYRLPRLRPEQEFDSIVSREGVFLLNNLLLVGITFATLWGTLFPIISDLVRKQTMTVGPPFYNQVMTPLFGLLVLAMGIGPLLAWRRTSVSAVWRNISVPVVVAALCAALLPFFGVTNIAANVGFSLCAFTAMAIGYEIWRGVRVRHSHGEPYPLAFYNLFNRYRQRYGGYVVHLGLVMLVVGIIGSYYFQQQRDVSVKPGTSVEIAGYKLTYIGNILEDQKEKDTVTSQVQVWHNGQSQGYIYPGRVIYQNYPDQPTSLISISTFGLTDVYVFLANWDGASEATLRVFVNPLVPLLWYGGTLMLLGGVLCWWPDRRRTLATTRTTVTAKPKQGVEVVAAVAPGRVQA